ncbi:sulfatase-like hydrolase/transferase [Microbacterium sp. NPDC089698]|uniref:sulfatase-like hydrolase/transferase n=1 Tax=Microbacterium sp. NPDC089698 TaxID=3364200 RepID=UPI00381DF772
MDSDKRPNVLWIVSEDCPPWFGCYGDRLAATPAIDALAERGVVFTAASSPAPVCAPSRFGLLTGIAPESHSPADRMRSSASVPDWMTTYPELFRDAGYYCTNNAKTDYNASFDPDAIWAESSATAHWRNRPEGAPFVAVFNFDASHESAVFDEDSPFMAALAPFLAQMDRKPFPPAIPLDAIEVPPYLPDDPAVRRDFSVYYSAVAAYDAFVAGLLAQLEEDGLAEDTIVLLTSDHGGVMPRSKRFLYEEGVHVPLVIATPQRLGAPLGAPGTRVPSPVSTLAIAPTLLGLAGLDAPAHMGAEPLTRTLPAHAYSARNRMDERYQLARTVRSGRYRYIRNYTPHRPHLQHQAFAWNAAGYRAWERAHLDGRLDAAQERWWRPAPGAELYDLESDPHEVVNLAGSAAHAEVEQELRTALRAHILAVHDNGFLAEDSPARGWDESRAPGAYPLERVLALADRGADRDASAVEDFLAALRDPDPTVRRWGAIGLLALAPDPAPGPAAVALRRVLEDPDPSVVIPAAEALARIAGDEAAYRVLAGILRDHDSVWSRLEAANALTFLDLDRVRPHRDAVETAAGCGHEYLGSAARYLLFQLDGTYTPDSVVFDASAILSAR